MTLTKQKPRRPTPNHRKRTGQHHKQGQHYIKAYWPYLPMMGILVLGILANSWFARVNHKVLGYSTDISIQSLLNATNAQRSNQGLNGLNVNSQLDQAAQAKANDMATRNYWSHNTPDGRTPWTFITATGYHYQAAGENLAYGFSSTADTMAGWMNSPEHRANILNASYSQVGFGIANIPDYQSSGPETLVVAMYALPASSIVAAATPTANTPATSLATAYPLSSRPRPESAQQQVPRLQLLAGGQTAPSWSMLAISMLIVGAFGFIFIRHSFAWHKVLVRGERFVLHHPLLDVTAITVLTAGLVLSQTSGLIR